MSMTQHYLKILFTLLKETCMVWKLLQTSFMNTLNTGYKTTQFDPYLQIRDKGDYFEYLGTHKDDLMVVIPDSEGFMGQIQSYYKIKKLSEPTYHLGCYYDKDENGYFYIGSDAYVKGSLEIVAVILKMDTLCFKHIPS